MSDVLLVIGLVISFILFGALWAGLISDWDGRFMAVGASISASLVGFIIFFVYVSVQLST